MVPFIWFPNKVCQLHERAPERAWVGPSNLSLSREPFSYTQNWLYTSFSFSAWFPCIWFPLSKCFVCRSARERATNYSFQKWFYIQVPIVCFPSFFGLSWCIVCMSAQPTIPCQNEPPFRNNICHFATYRDCLSYSRPYLCASTHHPTQTVGD